MPYSEGFGEAVRAAIGERTLFAAGQLCGLDATTIWKMRRGVIPRRVTLAAFANGLGINGRARTELFRLAGYVPIPDFTPGAPEPVAP